MSDGRLDGEVVVVTGGSRGIGRAVAERAHREGASVAVLDVAPLEDPPSDGLFALPCDVTDETAVADAFRAVADRLGPVSVLVNNAGRNSNADVVGMSSAEWDEFFALDLKAAWLCSRAAVPQMRERGRGSIVTVASVHAHMTAEGAFPYGAAKAGLLGLSRSMALDLGPEGIRSNTVSPGYTATRLVDELLQDSDDPGLRERIESVHALRRIGRPDEVAAVICFLASDEASFVTGADWIVDGGISARFA